MMSQVFNVKVVIFERIDFSGQECFLLLRSWLRNLHLLLAPSPLHGRIKRCILNAKLSWNKTMESLLWFLPSNLACLETHLNLESDKYSGKETYQTDRLIRDLTGGTHPSIFFENTAHYIAERTCTTCVSRLPVRLQDSSIHQLIPCIRNSRQAPMAAILNSLSSHSLIICLIYHSIYRRVRVLSVGCEPTNVQVSYWRFHPMKNVLQNFHLWRVLSQVFLVEDGLGFFVALSSRVPLPSSATENRFF